MTQISPLVLCLRFCHALNFEDSFFPWVRRPLRWRAVVTGGWRSLPGAWSRRLSCCSLQSSQRRTLFSFHRRGSAFQRPARTSRGAAALCSMESKPSSGRVRGLCILDSYPRVLKMVAPGPDPAYRHASFGEFSALKIFEFVFNI